MKKANNYLIDKLKKVFYYVSLGLIFIVIGLMVCVPFFIKKVSFKGDDLVFNKKTYDVLSVKTKVNINILGEYVNTGISYNKYCDSINKFSKYKTFKKILVVDFYLLFVLLELITIHYIISNIIKIFVDREEDNYKLFIIKKSFLINIICLYLLDFLRCFIYRNTMLVSYNSGLILFYFFSILMFSYILRMINLERVLPLKEKKQYGKNKENN